MEGGPPGFTPDYSSRALLRNSTTSDVVFIYRAVTVFGTPFQGTSTDFAERVRGSYNPAPTRRTVWPVPFSLATTQGISFDFSSSRYLDVSVHQVRLTRKRVMTGSRPPGCPIRPSRDQCVCATPPGLSQLTAAFIASVCPGIPHMPSLA